MRLDIQLFAVTKNTKFSESNISVANNTSSLTIAIEFSANNTSTYFSSETLTCTCNGVTKSKKVAHPKGGKASASFTFDNIAHNSDGTKTVSWSWSCATGTTVLGTVSASGSRTLTKIARASTPTFSDNPATLGEQITITTNAHSNTYIHTITYSIGETSGLIGLTVGSSTTWTPPLSLASEITNGSTGTCIIKCSTKDTNLALIGETETQLQLVVPSSVVPSVSIGTLTEADTTMQSLNWGVFVQNKSKLNIPITATGIYDSTIQSVVTTINGLNFTGTSVITSTLVTAGTNTISTTVTDSRGRTATATKTYNVETYSNPNIEIAQAQRCLSDGTLSDNGTYVLIDYKASISSVNNNNSKLHRIGYKKTTDANYTYVTLSSSYNANIQDQVSSFTISADYAYDIIFEATDSFMTASIERVVDTGFDLLNFNASGKAMAIGKVSEAGANEELLEVGLPTEFLEDIETQNIDAVDITANDITANSVTINNKNVLLPYELYSSSTGETGDVTLSDSSANYDYLEVYYSYEDNSTMMFNKVYDPDGKNIQLSGNFDNVTHFYITLNNYSISGTTMTLNDAVRWRFATGGSASTRTDNVTSLKVYKVIGYR